LLISLRPNLTSFRRSH